MLKLAETCLLTIVSADLEISVNANKAQPVSRLCLVLLMLVLLLLVSFEDVSGIDLLGDVSEDRFIETVGEDDVDLGFELREVIDDLVREELGTIL